MSEQEAARKDTPGPTPESIAPEYERLMRRATLAAVAVAVVLIATKGTVYWFTGSIAMLGTLTDSLLDGAASLLNLFAVRASLVPPDEEHRFGHGKAEALAGLGQSIFIFGSAGYITFEAVTRLLDPRPVENSAAGIAVVVFAIVLTLGLVAYQRHVVSRTRSVAIEADSIHYRGDLLMNLSVIAALILSGWLGFHWADPLFGLVIAGLIGWSAAKIVRNAFNQLMDREFSEEERERIKEIARQHPEVVNLHELKTRTSGIYTFIQFHLEMDGAITLTEAHRIAEEVEREVMEAFPGSEVLIHQDPAGTEKITRFQRA
ncbi:cation diffusion facilitator family transporter [Parvibaculum sp.]|jgi:ferrous-iron efflux pump FieF|uniref:cation diffusion facilitator family transporter n=3 Tax=Parvibaculum sp. TaxID=2024848 RepID=UPI001B204063|nr:cation diffusion facilitator family transporter [Parvibaculum sp.]MBO6678513.1 cation diffusion facilitator family transporter [Parvibaculum sp.]MBO6685114.1 cation diffusion facilitator family transporter [Parvibaculum sp.]MBO6904164.1 cation diffusion facilitator family transporter [Parvibaculum sp.]